MSKLCKDCRYYEKPKAYTYEPAALCHHPNMASKPDLVEGGSYPGLCNWARAAVDMAGCIPLQCGPEGRFWEERPKKVNRERFWWRNVKPVRGS